MKCFYHNIYSRGTLFEFIVAYKGVIRVLQMETGELLQSFICSAHTTPSYAARISNDLSYKSLKLPNPTDITLKPIKVKYPASFIDEPEANIGIFGINMTSSFAFPFDFSGKW